MKKEFNNKEENRNNKLSQSGYAILFVVLLASIILAMTVGIANIALKEVGFANTAKDSNVSFFAADTAGECAVYNLNPLRLHAIDDFANPPQTLYLTCEGIQIQAPQTISSGGYSYDFRATGPISVDNGKACGYVNIFDDTVLHETTITAHGFNVNCSMLTSNSTGLSSARQVERVLTYVISND